VVSYLAHQGDKLLDRFDRHAYRALVRAMDSHDIGRDRGGVVAALGPLAKAALARALAGRTRLGFRGELLRRVRETPTQTALTPQARAANVAEAFQAGRCAGLRILLVDDVFTTGATLAAAAGALAEGGAAAVAAVTFARAREPLARQG
jgi:homoserine acetyltransferase